MQRPISIQTATVTTDTTVQYTAIKTEGWKSFVELPTFAVGIITATCQVYCQVSNTSTTSTFRRVHWGTVENPDAWLTDSSSGNYMVELPNRGWLYTRLELTKTATATYSPVFHVVGESN